MQRRYMKMTLEFPVYAIILYAQPPGLLRITGIFIHFKMEPSTIQVEGIPFHNVRKTDEFVNSEEEKLQTGSSQAPPGVMICGKPVLPPSTAQPLEDLKKDQESSIPPVSTLSSPPVDRPFSPNSSILVCGKPFNRSLSDSQSKSQLQTPSADLETPLTSSTTTTTTSSTTTTTTTSSEQASFPELPSTTCVTLRNVNILESKLLSSSDILKEKMESSELLIMSQQEKFEPPNQPATHFVNSRELTDSILQEISKSQPEKGMLGSYSESTPIVVHIHNHTHVWKGGFGADSLIIVLLLILVAFAIQSF